MDIKELIKDKSKLNAETLAELKDIVEKYPFYQTARLLYVANLYLLHDAAFGKELRKASVMVPDRTALFNLTEGENYKIETTASSSSLIETENDGNRTVNLINSFLKHQPEGESADTAKKDQPSIADLTTDYASFLLQQDDIETENQGEEQPRLKGADLIDNFIEETKGKQRFEIQDLSDDYFASQNEGNYLLSGSTSKSSKKSDEDFTSPTLSDEDEEIYTESMVKIYIRQQRYEQALEILRKICLNNPKKSSNFAAQMQLLEIIIAQK